MTIRKVSRNPTTGSYFIHLPKSWCNQHITMGWDSKQVKIVESSKLLIEPYPAKPCALVMTKTPLRLPLAGGGTDLPEYYTRHGSGFWISGAINKYTYIILKHRFEEESKFVYSRTEYVTQPSQFSHNILRTILTKYNLIKHIELISIADLPSRIGLGSSGSFTVGLLNAVHSFLNIEETPSQIAEEAYEIERNLLGRKVGKQDQYTAALGGIRMYFINQKGQVSSKPLEGVSTTLKNYLMLFYIDKRTVSTSEAVTAMIDEDRDKIALLSTKMCNALSQGNIQEYGKLLNKHWQIKSSYQPQKFADIINLAKQNGAISGKLCGAGGGGCVLLVCEPKYQLKVTEAMESVKAIYIPFEFEPYGTEVIQ